MEEKIGYSLVYMVSDISSYEESILKERQEDEYMHLDFRDTTNGDTTYIGGRFLIAEMPKDGKIVVDFNQAYNPPCAYTDYAACPLPPT